MAAAPTDYSTTPIQAAAVGGLGGWPVPLLDVPFKLLGLRPIQWAYLFGAFWGWDTTSRLLEPLLFHLWYPGALTLWLPAPVRSLAFDAWWRLGHNGAPWVWLVLALGWTVFGLVGCFSTWHGRTLLGVVRVGLSYGATPRVSVWRPYEQALLGRPEWAVLERRWAAHRARQARRLRAGRRRAGDAPA
jgi:hypothetical protein